MSYGGVSNSELVGEEAEVFLFTCSQEGDSEKQCGGQSTEQLLQEGDGLAR